MNPKDIKIGSTYINRGAGHTMRKVLDMGEHISPPWTTTEKICVLYEQSGMQGTLSLRSFVSWAGKEIEIAQYELPLVAKNLDAGITRV